MPVEQEQVTVERHPKVTGEVEVKKHPVTEEKQIHTQVRKEVAYVERTENPDDVTRHYDKHQASVNKLAGAEVLLPTLSVVLFQGNGVRITVTLSRSEGSGGEKGFPSRSPDSSAAASE